MTAKRIVDNTNRPAQPEPGEDPAAKKAPVRPVPKRRQTDDPKFKERRGK